MSGFALHTKDGKVSATVTEVAGPGVPLYKLEIRMPEGTYKYKRQLPDQKLLIQQAKKWINSFDKGASIVLTDFTKVASSSKVLADVARELKKLAGLKADAPQLEAQAQFVLKNIYKLDDLITEAQRSGLKIDTNADVTSAMEALERILRVLSK